MPRAIVTCLPKLFSLNQSNTYNYFSEDMKTAAETEVDLHDLTGDVD